MADIYYAYKFLSEALELNLSDVQLNRAEAMFRKAYAQHLGLGIPEKKLYNYEFFATLRPRAEPKAKPIKKYLKGQKQLKKAKIAHKGVGASRKIIK